MSKDFAFRAGFRKIEISSDFHIFIKSRSIIENILMIMSKMPNSRRDVQNLVDHGAIMPNDLNGNLTMEEHAIDSTGSQYISLTTDPKVAEEFATSGTNPSGLVAEIDGQKAMLAGGLRAHDPSKYGPEARNNVLDESEVLHEGPITVGALDRIYSVPSYRGPANGQ